MTGLLVMACILFRAGQLIDFHRIAMEIRPADADSK
jgi:hypothetical protein